MVKKLLYLLFLFTALQTAAAPAEHGPQDWLFRKLQEKVEKPMVQRQDHFYQSAYDELTDYYNRKDFASPAKTTGWYRVNNFLTWLKQNEKQVQKDFKTAFPSVCADDTCSMNWQNWHIYQRSWWVFLGVHYVADKQKKSLNYSKLSLLFCSESNCAKTGDNNSKHHIKINVDDSYSIPSDINLGIHEGTHLLPALSQAQKSASLSEFATFWTSYLYALPVKRKDMHTFADGIRDFIRTANTKPEFLIHWEYHPYVAGRFLVPQLRGKNLLSLTVEKNHHADDSLIESVINYIYAANGRYFEENRAEHLKNLSIIAPSWNELIQQGFAKRTQLEKWFTGKYPAHYAYIGQVDLEKLPELKLTGKYHMFIEDYLSNCSTPPQKRFYRFEAAAPVSKEQYLRKIYAPFEVTESLKNFYSNIEKTIPAEVKKEMFANIPAIYEPMFSPAIPRDQDRLSHLIWYKYGNQVTTATLHALKQGGIKPLAIPTGYL